MFTLLHIHLFSTKPSVLKCKIVDKLATCNQTSEPHCIGQVLLQHLAERTLKLLLVVNTIFSCAQTHSHINFHFLWFILFYLHFLNKHRILIKMILVRGQRILSVVFSYIWVIFPHCRRSLALQTTHDAKRVQRLSSCSSVVVAQLCHRGGHWWSQANETSKPGPRTGLSPPRSVHGLPSPLHSSPAIADPFAAYTAFRRAEQRCCTSRTCSPFRQPHVNGFGHQSNWTGKYERRVTAPDTQSTWEKPRTSYNKVCHFVTGGEGRSARPEISKL